MRRVHFAAALVVVGLSAQLDAAELTIQSAREYASLTLQARRIDTADDAFARSVDAPGTLTIALSEGLWEVRVTGDGVWSAPVLMRDRDTASIRTWPTTRLSGQSNAVTDLRAELTPLEADGPAGIIDCETDGKEWSCVVPIGHYDIRFLSRGCAPEHRFGISTNRDGHVLADALRFIPGASLSGRLSTARGVEAELKDVELRLVPEVAEESGSVLLTRADARGFFQFKGLSPGSYSISARKGELSARSVGVNVLASAAAQLNAPLILDRPKRLTVSIVPPRDPELVPWRVRLLSLDPTAHRREVVSESAVDAAGEAVHTVHAGAFDVEVRRANGARWSSQSVTIDQDDVTLPLMALGERIEGSVTLGDRPLAAAITFDGEGGVALKSGEDGRFVGEIPPGDEERLVLVHATTPTVRRTLRVKPRRAESGELSLDLHLPATTLIGRVLHEDRTPAPETMVTATAEGVFEQAFTESDGSFQIAGFASGKYRVTADDAEGQSAPVSVELEENEPNEIELVVRRYARAHGRMRIGTTPVIEAQIYAIPRDSWSPILPTARTDERGHFTLQLPPGTTTYDIFAMHPAFEVVLGRLIHDQKKIVNIAVHQSAGTLIVEGAGPDELFLQHAGANLRLTWVAREAGGTVEETRVTMPRLQPGDYTVCSQKTNLCKSGYVPANGSLTLALR